MSKNKKRAPSGPKCTSTISGGSFRCALTGDHDVHCSAEPKRGQYAMWMAQDDGRVKVIPYQNGKEMSDGWFEDPPNPAAVAPHVCASAATDAFGKPKKGAHAISCQREFGHDGPHRDGPHGELEFVTEWEDSRAGTVSYNRKAQSPVTLEDEPEDPEADAAAFAALDSEEGDDPFEDEVRGDDDRELARKMREDREAHARELESETATTTPTVGWTEEPAPRPGDTRSNQSGQSERWCWGLVGGWGWRSYPTSKGKGCTGCGRHKADCLCKRMPKEVSIGTFPITPVTPGDDRVAPLERIGDHEVHPIATKFRMIGQISAKDWAAFLEDIRANGQRKRIVRVKVGSKWLILDGRNRLRACIDLGIVPLFRDFGSEPGDGSDPIAFVLSENVHRRHEDETSRAFLGAELVPMYEAQARERMVAGKRNPAPDSAEGESGEAVEQAAKAVNVGKTSVKAALTVMRDAAPEVVAASRDRGQIKVSTAADLSKLPKQRQREIVEKIGGGELRSGKVRALVNQEKKRDVVRKINEQRVAPMPLGPFGVIYGDYPWLYENSDQHEGSRGHMNYPGMPMEDIIAHARATSSRAAKDCVLALWVTNAFVTKIGPVLEAYGAEHRSMFTWPKPKFVHGTWGRGQTEHLVIASIGAPVHTLNELSTLLQPFRPARPGEHSSKPAEVAELLAKHCSGPFLELFARDQRDGWTCWGAEVDKFTRAA